MDISLSRIIIFGQDVDKLKTFYTENFKLTVTSEINGEWIVLNAGTVEIALHRIGEAYRTEGTFKAVSNTKLVFSINEDLPLMRQRLMDQDILMREVQQFAGVNSLYCDGADPEGNVFQLEQRLG